MALGNASSVEVGFLHRHRGLTKHWTPGPYFERKSVVGMVAYCKPIVMFHIACDLAKVRTCSVDGLVLEGGVIYS